MQLFSPFTQLLPAIFYGCDDYINIVITKMFDVDGAHLAILGSGGIGKTSIALSILHDSWIRAKFKEYNCHFIICEALTSGAHLVDALVQALAVMSSSSAT